jgi:hypothetical protein
MRVEVAERDKAGIKRLRFDFDVPLEDPSLILFHFEDRDLKRLTPPLVGTRWIEKEPPILFGDAAEIGLARRFEW